MIGDPLQKVQPGEPLKIQAETWNQFIDAAIAAKMKMRQQDRPLPSPPENPVFVWVRNDSGVDLDEFSVVRLSSAAITYDDNADAFKYDGPVVNGDVPGSASDRDVIAVLQEPLPAQTADEPAGIGRAVVLGLTPVMVHVPSGGTAWKWADVTIGATDKLTMRESPGLARVVWKQSGTGDKFALVCLLDAASGDFITGDFASGTTVGDIRTVTGLEPSTTVAGNTRGAGSIDFQMERSVATQVASGAYAIIIGGTGNTASATLSTVVGGIYNAITSSQSYSSMIGGLRNTISDSSSAAFIGGGIDNLISNGSYAAILGGRDSKADKWGQIAHGNIKFSVVGDSQTSVLVSSTRTTGGSTATAQLDGTGGAAFVTIATDTTWAFVIVLVARRTDANNESAAYEFKGCIDNNGGTVALVGSVIKTVIAEDTAAWDADVVADNTNKAIQINVTGESGKSINWVARIELTEVTG